jgi:hypothetical protein
MSEYFTGGKWKLAKGFFVVAWGCKKSYLYVAKTILRNEVLNIVEKDLKIQFGSRVHMLPLLKRHILECQINLLKKMHLHIYNLSAFVKFRRKSILFVVYVKRQEMSCEMPYF